MQIIPLARVVMQTKSQITYELVLQKLKELRPNIKVKEVMCDFEEQQENAWRSQFPHVRVHGCLFHSSKVICCFLKDLQLILLCFISF